MDEEGFHTEDAPPVEHHRTNKYQLYREDVDPCRWYLADNEHEPRLISSGELNTQPKFRNWHSDHGYKPPHSTERHVFEKMVEGLYDRALPYTKTLPFSQTNANVIENLVAYFDKHIINMYRARGLEFLEGKVGDFVRILLDEERIYFKFRSMKRSWRVEFYANQEEIDALKRFITDNGGYQGEKGAREWFRWTYWLPLGLFDEDTKARWFRETDNGEVSNVVRLGKS
jgi:hypothetical protein